MAPKTRKGISSTGSQRMRREARKQGERGASVEDAMALPQQQPRAPMQGQSEPRRYLVGDGICYTTLCESRYPRKLAFNYLEDLQKELQKVDSRIFESFSEPYAFKRFDYVIGHIRKRYMDTKTQENLYKLNSDPRNELKITTEEFANIMRNCESSGYEVGTSSTITQTNSAVWGSNFLEVIALKWIPITIIVVVAATLLWAGAILNEYDTLSAW